MIVLVLLYDEKSGEGVRAHYITASNVKALLRNGDTNEEAHCLRCFHTFAGEGAVQRLQAHESECNGIMGGGVQRISMPKEGEKIFFKEFEKTQRLPFAIYADFESSMCEVKEEEQRCGASSERLKQHVANSYEFATVGPDGRRIDELSVFYRGPDAARHCLQELKRVSAELRKRLQAHRERPRLSAADEAAWAAAEVCHLCGKGEMTPWVSKKPKESDKVRDHCHVTGEYRGAAHSRCNLAARTNYKIPVFVHNLKGYDAHLLFTAMSQVEGKLKVIATNSEKYVSFQLGDLVFKDSCQFLQSSLEGLAKNLPADDFVNTKQLAEELGLDLELLKRKGVYPYAWVDGGAEKFEQTELPPIEAFHNDLDDEACKPSDYQHAQNVWKAARCKNFGEYHDLYLRLDVALLADVFESFRRSSHKTYGLDPAHFYTLPGFSWAALFKYTGAELDLLTDPDMYIACEQALRGGVCAVSMRHCKANNPRVSGYDSKKPKTWLRYDDANNLYGLAMSQSLPQRNFRWGNPTEWNEERVRALADDAAEGAFLCVDLEYPAGVHEAHNDYPLCPERMEVPRAWLSPYQEELVGKTYPQCEKLVPNLRDKTHYWIHYRNLKFVLDQGLKLKAVHKVLEFEQAAWMKPYIDFNTKMRAQAKNDFEKDLYKLMNNACFGKTMENLRDRRDIEALRVDSSTWRKWVAEPSYKGRKTIDEDLVIGERARRNLLLNKPVYVGVAVLDLSKLHMWGFWYDYLKPKFGERVRLCYTDTDSLIYEVQSEEDPSAAFVGSAGSMFDTSEYPAGHPMHCNDNKKVLGKFKDEAKGVAIAEFVGLRPKLYALRLEASEVEARKDSSLKVETKKSKGTKKSVVKKDIRFTDYLTTLETRREMRHSQMGFKTNAHRIYTERVTKTSLSALDTKRYILPDGVQTLAYGHYRAGGTP